MSPLLANIALTPLDEHFAAQWAALGPEWQRRRHRRAGNPVMRLIRYADDFVVLVAGQRVHAEALWQEVSNVLSSMGLRLSVSKTRVTHVEDGFDFLAWRLQRRAWKGRPGKRALYAYPAKAALRQVMDQIRALTRRHRHRSLCPYR